MKRLIAILLVFCATKVSASAVYYCSDTLGVGIEPESLDAGRYEPQRFKISLDWETKSLNSNDLYLGDVWQKTCFLFYDKRWGTNLNCMSEAGVSFSINRETLKYNRASIYNNHNGGNVNQDTIKVATGSCEKF